MAALSAITRLQTTAGSQLQQITLPKIPKVPLPEEVIKRVPQLHAWYEQFHSEMDKWREQTNIALRGTALPE